MLSFCLDVIFFNKIWIFLLNSQRNVLTQLFLDSTQNKIHEMYTKCLSLPFSSNFSMIIPEGFFRVPSQGPSNIDWFQSQVPHVSPFSIFRIFYNLEYLLLQKKIQYAQGCDVTTATNYYQNINLHMQWYF